MKILFFTTKSIVYQYFDNKDMCTFYQCLNNQSYKYYISDKFSYYYNKKDKGIYRTIFTSYEAFLDFDLIIFESIEDNLNDSMMEEIKRYVLNGGNILFLFGSFNNCEEIIKLANVFNDVIINNDILFYKNSFSPKIRISLNYNNIIIDEIIRYKNGCTFEIKSNVDFYVLQDSKTQRLINSYKENKKNKWGNVSNEIKPILVYKKHGKGSVMYWGSKDFILKKKFKEKEYEFFIKLIFIFYLNLINNRINRINHKFEYKSFNVIYNDNEKFEYNNLAYFASGPYKRHYKNLKFKNIYLIDYSAFKPTSFYFIYYKDVYKDYFNTFDFNKKIKNLKNENNNVYLMDMDVFEAIEYFKKNNIKLDCIVNINEGLNEGGGEYSLKTQEFLGYVMPVLKREFLYIVEYPYFFNGDNLKNGRKLNKKLKRFFNYGYNKVLLDINDDRFIDPNIFSDYNWCVKKTVNLFVEKIKPELIKIKLKNNNIDFYLLNDSIWNYEDHLDFIITTYNYLFDDLMKLYDKKEKVINVSIEDYMKYDKILCLLKIFNEKKIERIGITPPGFNSIEVFTNILDNNDFIYPKEIILFYLDKNDYKGFINNNKNFT